MLDTIENNEITMDDCKHINKKLNQFFECFTADRAAGELNTLFFTALASEKANQWDHITREDKIFFVEELKSLIKDLNRIQNQS